MWNMTRCLFLTAAAAKGHSGRGTDFFLAFPEHLVSTSRYRKALTLSIVVFNPTDSSVDVDVLFPKMTSLAGKTITLRAGEFTRFPIDDVLQVQVRCLQRCDVHGMNRMWSGMMCLQICLLAAVAWCEVRPKQGYVQKQKKEPPGSRQVKRALQTGRCLTSLWGFGGVQCVPVGHPLDQIKPGRLGATHTDWFPVCLALPLF